MVRGDDIIAPEAQAARRYHRSRATIEQAIETQSTHVESDHWPYPGHWRPFVAFIIDQVFLGSIFFTLVAIGSLVIFLASDEGRVDASERWYFTAAIIIAAIIPIWILYHLLLWGTTGQTLGKWLMDLRVLRRDGTPLGLGRASYRLLGYTLSLMTLHLGALLSLRGSERRTLHDRIAQTVVVHHFEPWMVEWVDEKGGA